MIQQEKNHWIPALLLCIAGLLIILLVVLTQTRADNATVSATTSNEKPTASITAITSADGVTSIATDGAALTLTENTTTTIHVKGTVTDPNGCSEVVTGGAVDYLLVHDAEGSGDACMNEPGTVPTYCYMGTGCAVSSCSGTTANFDCEVDIWYNAHPTNTGSEFAADSWHAYIAPQDATMVNASDNDFNVASSTFEIAASPAIALGGNVAFGTLDLGETSADVSLSITNTGNVDDQGVEISSTDMTCTTGTIDKGNIKVSASSGTAYGSMTALTGSASAISGLTIARATATSSPSSATTYFKLQIPASGVAGSCSGTLTLSTN